VPQDFFRKFDAIINLAALPGQLSSWNNAENYMRSNFLTVDTLLKNVIQNKLSPKIIHVSTSSVYGSNVNTSISRKLDPCNPYGVTKLAAENLISAYLNYYEFDIKIMRLFSVYGPHQRPDMGIHKFLSSLKSGGTIQIYGDGNQKRQVSFVGDVCEIILKALNTKTDPNNHVTDVSGPNVYTVNELVELCGSVTGIVPKIEYLKTPYGDQLNTQNHYTNVEHMFGFENYTSIVDGIKQQYLALGEFNE
jgi:nucleoside-diphosphate-sugar epimerase